MGTSNVAIVFVVGAFTTMVNDLNNHSHSINNPEFLEWFGSLVTY
jgi:hypothetical protein